MLDHETKIMIMVSVLIFIVALKGMIAENDTNS